MKNDKLKSKFAEYVARQGFRAKRIEYKETGLYAYIFGWTSKSNKAFTQVLQGGTILRLSLNDLDNKLIVGDFKFKI